MCYGDSLTDGPPRGGWPSWLHRLLAEQPPAPVRRFEVLNAGVAGYSSHQGVLRFLQEVDRYQPDLVLVSFGWNDAAQAIGQPDKTFKIPPWPVVVCQRALVRYRAYLVLMYYTQKWRAEPPVAAPRPGFSAGQRRRLPGQHGPIPNRGCPQGHRDRVSHPAAQASAGGAEQERDLARIGAQVQRGAGRLGPSRTTSRCSTPSTTSSSFQPDLFSDECHFTPQGYERMAKLVRDELVAAKPVRHDRSVSKRPVARSGVRQR